MIERAEYLTAFNRIESIRKVRRLMPPIVKVMVKAVRTLSLQNVRICQEMSLMKNGSSSTPGKIHTGSKEGSRVYTHGHEQRETLSCSKLAGRSFSAKQKPQPPRTLLFPPTDRCYRTAALRSSPARVAEPMRTSLLFDLKFHRCGQQEILNV
jgi:hypothetical protein